MDLELAKYDYIKPIYVIPVGLDYSNHTNMGANLLINIADPIDLVLITKHSKRSKYSNHCFNERTNRTGICSLNIKSENTLIFQ